MKNLLNPLKSWCFVHKYSKWKYIETIDILGKPDRLTRVCLICNKEQEYIGITDTDITNGEKSPYIYKNC